MRTKIKRAPTILSKSGELLALEGTQKPNPTKPNRTLLNPTKQTVVNEASKGSQRVRKAITKKDLTKPYRTQPTSTKQNPTKPNRTQLNQTLLNSTKPERNPTKPMNKSLILSLSENRRKVINALCSHAIEHKNNLMEGVTYNMMADTCGVRRTSIKTCMRGLKLDGLIEIYAPKGGRGAKIIIETNEALIKEYAQL